MAAAQIYSVKGDVEANIEIHLKAIKLAAKHNVDFIIFPELSLTGYELELGESLAVNIDDEIFIQLDKAAKEYNITITAGMPIKSGVLPKLGLIVFSPNGDKIIYNKMNVHISEADYFANGDEYKTLDIKDEKIALAICADINNPEHIKGYTNLGATVYATSVLISETAYQAEIEALHKNAIEHKIPVLLSNHNKPTGKYLPAGKSGILFPNGDSVTTGKEDSALIIAEKQGDNWQSVTVNLNI